MKKTILNKLFCSGVIIVVAILILSKIPAAADKFQLVNKNDPADRLKFIKSAVKLKNDTTVLEFYEENKELEFSPAEIKLIAKTIKEKLSVETSAIFIEEQNKKNELTEELKQILEEYKSEIYSKRFERMRVLFFNAESYFNAENYEKAAELYSEAIGMYSNSTGFEITKSKERLEQILKKTNEKKINELKKTVEKENADTKEIITAYYSFYHDFYKIASEKDKNNFDNSLFFLLEKYKNSKDALDIYNAISPYIDLKLKKKILRELCIKFLSKDEDENYIKYFAEFSKISDKGDTEITMLEKQFLNKKIYFYLKIILVLLIAALLAVAFIFKKKLYYRYLKIKIRYSETTGGRFELYEMYQKMLEIKFDEEIQLKYLKLSFELKKSDNAILSIFYKISDLSKLDYQLLFDIIKLQYKTGKYDEVFQTIKKAKQLYKDIDRQIDLLKFEFTSYLGVDRRLNAINTGAEIFKIKFEPQIIRDYIDLICVQGDFSHAFTYLRLWLNTQQNAIRKIAEFTESLIKKYPEQIKFYDFIGIVYRKLGDIDKAIAVYEMLEEKHQMKLPVYSALYDLYSKKKDLQNSIRALNKIVMIREDNKEDKYNLALLYYEANDYEQTVRLMTELLIKDQNHLRAIDVLKIIGYSYLKEKNYDRAIKIFEFITTTSNIEITDVRIELGNLYIGANNPDAAISTLQKITTGDKGSVLKSQVFVARALILKNDHNLAAEMLKQIDENDPFINSEIKKMITYYKALCYENMGDIELAKKYYQVVIMLDIKYKDANDRYKKLLE